MVMNDSFSVAAHTLGCKVNQYDTDALINQLKSMGLIVKNFSECADIYIVNTCTVTHVSDKKSRQMIRRARKANPNGFVAVCGCMAKHKPDDAGEADFVFDARQPDNFFELVRTMKANTPLLEMNSCPQQQNATDFLRTRAFLKIQDGCNRFCAYCIVPYARGALISRPKSDILTEASTLIDSGTLEIVLTGIQVASYGDDNGENLAALIRQVAKISGLTRLRLSSIDPWAVNDAFLSAVADSPTLCDHFHLSLQSGSDSVLQRMNRRYTTAEYAKTVEKLRKLRPACAITTDIIVGFPGETDADFQQSLDFVRAINFAQVHVFEYSPREGTPAATFNDQVPQRVKAERGVKMRALVAELRKNFLTSQVGKILPVLFETKNKGHSTNYCPVEVICNADLTNTIQHVEITTCTETTLMG